MSSCGHKSPGGSCVAGNPAPSQKSEGLAHGLRGGQHNTHIDSPRPRGVIESDDEVAAVQFSRSTPVEEEAFRGKTLARSPPVYRQPTNTSAKRQGSRSTLESTSSQESLQWDNNDITVIEVSKEEQDLTGKLGKVRKRTHSSPTPEGKRKKGALTCLLSKVEELQNLVGNNTRKDIKSAIASLGRIAKSLNKEVETLTERISSLEAEQERREEQAKKVSKTIAIEDLLSVSDYQGMEELLQHRWNEALFQHSEALLDYDVPGRHRGAVTCESGDTIEVVMGPRGRADNPGSCTLISRNERRFNGEGKVEEDGCTWARVNLGLTESQQAFDAIWKLRRAMEAAGCKWLELAVPRGIKIWSIRKMIEVAFQGFNGRVGVQRIALRKRVAKKLPIPSKEKSPPQRKDKGGAVLIEVQGKSFADTLRVIRNTITVDDLKTPLRTIRETSGGKVLLEAKSEEEANLLETLLRSRLPEAKVEGRTRGTLVQVSGMDACTTPEDVEKALRSELGPNLNTRVIAMRALPAGRQRAIVSIPREAARELLAKKRICIGLTACQVKECERQRQCFRCLEVGHIARDCKGPDRSKVCSRCAGDGHLAKECNLPQKCAICGSPDHRADSGLCQKERRSKPTRRRKNHEETDPEAHSPEVGREGPTHREGDGHGCGESLAA